MNEKEYKVYTNHKIGDYIEKSNGSYLVKNEGIVEVTINMIFPSSKKICPEKTPLQLK